ncbi:IS200/IS605 family transposase, partial [Oscillibacter valericigenes]|uniref:IS200/IS605 family transposase n=1 Tax=Oscillibacter valericigenes TaxID=351091 RepID=UPI001F4229CA
TVSMLNYHFVFCPRYRRKIFLIDGLETRFKESVLQICEQNQMEVLAMECHVDHVHLFLSSLPKYSPADIMRIVKGNTSRVLLSEFSDILRSPTVWTRSYFVSTAGNVSSETIRRYVETQKTR